MRTIEFMKAEGFSSSVDHPLLSNISGKGIVNHPFPMNYMLKPWKLGEEFYQSIKFGIVQYVRLIKFCFLSIFHSSNKLIGNSLYIFNADDHKKLFCCTGSVS